MSAKQIIKDKICDTNKWFQTSMSRNNRITSKHNNLTMVTVKRIHCAWIKTTMMDGDNMITLVLALIVSFFKLLRATAYLESTQLAGNCINIKGNISSVLQSPPPPPPFLCNLKANNDNNNKKQEVGADHIWRQKALQRWRFDRINISDIQTQMSVLASLHSSQRVFVGEYRWSTRTLTYGQEAKRTDGKKELL